MMTGLHFCPSRCHSFGKGFTTKLICDISSIIMDIMMPDLDGFSAVKEIRKTSDTSVIMLRVYAILLRVVKSSVAKADDNGHIIFEKDGFKVDTTAYKGFVDGVQVDMEPKECDLLFFLIRNKNIAVPREKIMTEVWGNQDKVRAQGY